jgi:hypothetical protein
MNSATDTRLMTGGLPHSEIPGSKLVCQLPEAYRRLQRPSSPVAAKASTICAYSLDHITPNGLARPFPRSLRCGFRSLWSRTTLRSLARSTRALRPRKNSSQFSLDLFRADIVALLANGGHVPKYAPLFAPQRAWSARKISS